MAPELALSAMKGLPNSSVVLDPMSGSGTAVSQAALVGYRAIGFDLDPLAVLISRVSSRRIDPQSLRTHTERLLKSISQSKHTDTHLPWIEKSAETQHFVRYWFGLQQRRQLSRIGHGLKRLSEWSDNPATVDALKIALSRIIITKEAGASLARDVSHSRPHRVKEKSDFDVLAAFRKSVIFVGAWLSHRSIKRSAVVDFGDARELHQLQSSAVDLVLTSPPYLNAIDYLRGHKLSLVWLGFTIEQLRIIRGTSIGSERSRTNNVSSATTEVMNAICDAEMLPARYAGMITRYSGDICDLMKEISRVLKPSGRAVLVVGDSCIHSVFVSNSNGIVRAARLNGLELIARSSREIPNSKRYLPITAGGAIGRRMRIEHVLTFRHA